MGINGNGLGCLLMGLDGVTYQVRLVGDISQSGASLTMSDSVPHGLNVGELCGFMLRNSIGTSSTKHTGTIVSLDSSSVEISFNHQEHRHLKRKKLTTNAFQQPSEQVEPLSMPVEGYCG